MDKYKFENIDNINYGRNAKEFATKDTISTEEIMKCDSEDYKFIVKSEKNISNNNEKIIATLLKKINFEEKIVHQPLLTKEMYMHNEKDYYLIENNYIINGNNKTSLGNYNGIYFEELNNNSVQTISTIIDLNKYPELTNANIISAIIFNGELQENQYTLEVYKTRNTTHIKYNYELGAENTQEFVLPNVDKGKISSREIKNIMMAIEMSYGNTEFIKLVSSGLEMLCDEINMHCIKETNDPILLELFQKKASPNKQEYFKLVVEELYTIANIFKEDTRTKIVK